MLTAEGKAKLTDFGLSKVKFETQKSNSDCRIS